MLQPLPQHGRRTQLRLCTAALLLAAAGAAIGAEPVRVPLVEGLVEVAAVQRATGDEEQITTVTLADADQVVFSTEFRLLGDGAVDVHTRTRRVRRIDLATGNRLNQVFQAGDADLFAGSTISRLSAASLATLKRDGAVALVLGTLPDLGSEGENPLLAATLSGRKYFRGTLARIEGGPATLDVVVNGTPTALPVVRGRGTFAVGGDRIDVEMWVLDDPGNPLLLQVQQGRSHGQVVRIDWPAPQSRPDRLEAALSDGDCRVSLDGIYFDTGSATLLPLSMPALAAVAALLAQHPDWTLRIEGHTDDVGATAANLDLSTRRALAVRDALVGRGIAVARLPATGFGESRPVAANSTLEGRAANRRVELARTCP